MTNFMRRLMYVLRDPTTNAYMDEVYRIRAALDGSTTAPMSPEEFRAKWGPLA